VDWLDYFANCEIIELEISKDVGVAPYDVAQRSMERRIVTKFVSCVNLLSPN
jgi:hypothetical protein